MRALICFLLPVFLAAQESAPGLTLDLRAVPPPKHQALELSEIMQNDPSTPQKLDLTKVKSMQDRFNRNPPNGSPVK